MTKIKIQGCKKHQHRRGKQTSYPMLIGLILCLAISSVLSMKIRCNAQKLKGPINLNMPLPFEKFRPNLNFVKPDSPIRVVKISPDTYELKGKFGFIEFLGNTREVRKVFIKSPSEHTVEGVQFAMEMQLYASGDKTDAGIVISKLFEKSSEENLDAKMLGFGSGKLKKLKKGEKFMVLEPISLMNLVSDSPAFINYQAETTTGNCEMVEWLISVETGQIGKSQLSEFSKDPTNTIKAKIATSSLRLTQNFNQELKLKIKKRVSNIKTLSHVKIYPSEAEIAKQKAQKQLKKKQAEMKRKKKKELRKKKIAKNKALLKLKREQAKIAQQKKLAKIKHQKAIKAQKYRKAKQKAEKEKKRKAKVKAELERKKKLKLEKVKRIKAKKIDAMKKQKMSQNKIINKLPKCIRKLFKTFKVYHSGKIVKIPPRSLLPNEILRKSTQKLLIKQNIHIIEPLTQQFPKPPYHNLQYRVVYFYRPSDKELSLMREYKKLLFTLEHKLNLAHLKRKKHKKFPTPMFYIPYIALVPKDFNPPSRAPVTTIPMYNYKSKHIMIQHLRKDEEYFTEKPTLQRKKVCLKWKMKIIFDKKGHAKHGRKCAKWKWVTLDKEKAIFQWKDKSLLNSNSSLKWIVKALSAGFIQ